MFLAIRLYLGNLNTERNLWTILATNQKSRTTTLMRPTPKTRQMKMMTLPVPREDQVSHPLAGKLRISKAILGRYPKLIVDNDAAVFDGGARSCVIRTSHLVIVNYIAGLAIPNFDSKSIYATTARNGAINRS